MTRKKLTKKEDNVADYVDLAEEVFTLPGGYRDEDGVIHTEFQIKEMTGVEEEAIAKADIKSNGGKVMRTLIERCCTRIGSLTKKKEGGAKWREIAQNLMVGDQDYIVLKIREQSIGEEIEVSHECTECKAKLDTVMLVSELPIVPFQGDFEIPFELPRGYKDKNGTIHREGTLRLPIGVDREILDPVSKKNLGEANTLMLSRCVLSLGTAHLSSELIRNLSVRDREFLFKLLKENMFGVDVDTEITCTNCLHEFKVSLNMRNFL